MTSHIIHLGGIAQNAVRIPKFYIYCCAGVGKGLAQLVKVSGDKGRNKILMMFVI